MPNLGFTFCVKLSKLSEKEVMEALSNRLICRIFCKITDDAYMQDMDALIKQLNVIATGGSGWVVKTLSRVGIKTVGCHIFAGSSYMETPTLLNSLKSSFLKVVNKRDSFCWWCCIAAVLFFFHW